MRNIALHIHERRIEPDYMVLVYGEGQLYHAEFDRERRAAVEMATLYARMSWPGEPVDVVAWDGKAATPEVEA